ncbi:MAG: electron transfer flavoprotein subunit alpha/FixB family protein, partial [Thermoguttaceae bacterium]|nr:electron transfer flavoprotein subunit alpha/FixB family protein [Thermoguttaceae bacterium]
TRLSPVEKVRPAGRTRTVSSDPLASGEDIVGARRIVAVGKGIKREGNIELARRLADRLNASLGATREVVDRGWLPYSAQIGLSGKTVVPELYIALGISGAVQHLAGMRTARKIVAVNTDPDAAIFQIADIGIVGDLFEVVPRLIDEFGSQVKQLSGH